jgi:hypothetical protein
MARRSIRAAAAYVEWLARKEAAMLSIRNRDVQRRAPPFVVMRKRTVKYGKEGGLVVRCADGTRYSADCEGLIHQVSPRHIAELRAAGCSLFVQLVE